VRTNCPGINGEEFYHGKWAIDWNVPKTDSAGRPLDVPVFAAGHGIAHIGGRQINCATDTGTTKGRGNWVWIDHGGGVVTMYYHLASFAAGIDGAAVTPRTRIGNAGSSGSPCREAKYLNYEVKVGGIRGDNVYMGQLNACISSGGSNTQVLLPSYLGLEDDNGDLITNWDDLPARPGQTMPATNKACVPTSPPATLPAPAAPEAVLVGAATQVSWPPPPDSALETMLGLEQWSATLGDYRPMTYRPVPADETSVLLTDVELGGRYRLSVAHRNSVGWSNWSSTTEITPALPPQRPVKPNVSSGLTWIRFDWSRPANNGTAVTGYEVERQIAQRDGSWSAPRITATQASDVRWNDLTSAHTYRLRVRALSAAGPSGWTAPLEITTVAPEPPDRPTAVTTRAGRTWVSVNWERPANNGAPVVGYHVARSVQRKNGSWSPWQQTRIDESSVRWNDLRAPTTFRVRIRALSTAGPSSWTAAQTVTTAQ
jgi:hypothetical protein